MTDLEVNRQGSIVMLVLHSPRGERWVSDNLSVEPWQFSGDCLFVDSRYIDDIIDGALGDGLVVSGDVGGDEEEEEDFAASEFAAAAYDAEFGDEYGLSEDDFEDLLTLEKNSD